MSKLRVQGGKLCVVAGQLEQCCESPGGCFAYLSECGCVNPDGEVAVPLGDILDNGRLWPVYYVPPTDTQPAGQWVLVRVSRTLDPGVPFSPFSGWEGRERCSTTECEPLSFRVRFRWDIPCPVNDLCVCARFAFSEIDYTYTREATVRARSTPTFCDPYEYSRRTTVHVTGWTVYDLVLNAIVAGSARQEITATGDRFGVPSGFVCAENLGPYAPFNSVVEQSVPSGVTLVGGQLIVLDPGLGSTPTALPYDPPDVGTEAPVDWESLIAYELDPCGDRVHAQLPCGSAWSVDVTVPDDCGTGRTGFVRDAISYDAGINRLNVSHTYERESYDANGLGVREVVTEIKRHGFRFAETLFSDPDAGFVLGDACDGSEPPANPGGPNIQPGGSQAGEPFGGLGRSGRSQPRPCLPCQQRRDAGLEAALDAQRRAANCQGCGDAGLDGLL